MRTLTIPEYKAFRQEYDAYVKAVKKANDGR